jgi:hypothetical protein
MKLHLAYFYSTICGQTVKFTMDTHFIRTLLKFIGNVRKLRNSESVFFINFPCAVHISFGFVINVYLSPQNVT